MSTENIADAVRIVTDLPPWLRLEEATRRYSWHDEEDAVLRRWWGRISRPELARRVNAVLRKRTGDSGAERSVDAMYCRAIQLGLPAYNGEEDEMYLNWAAGVAEIPYNVVHKAARVGELVTQRKGKKRYVTAADWEVWLLSYREKEANRARVLASIDEETVSKQQAMRLTGLGETQITRYLQTGVIRAWKIPDMADGTRGEWRVSLTSVQELIQARAEGRLHEILDGNAAYRALRKKQTVMVRKLRHAGRVKQQDPLTEPMSRYHPGCFTVAQVASYVELTTRTVYEALKAGQLTAEVVRTGGRPRYGVRHEEAQRYATFVARMKKAGLSWHTRQERQIAEAGLLSVRALADRWNVGVETVRRWTRAGKNGHVLPGRRWGRYLVFEPEDVARFEAADVDG